MSQQFFCPRLSEAIGSKILSLDQLFHTPSNFKFQNFVSGAFRSHISYTWKETAKILIIPQGFLYLKSPRMTFLEPNMDEGCRIFHRFNGNPSQDFFRIKKFKNNKNCMVSCKFFMIKNSNYLTIKPGVSLSSMPCH